MLSWLLLPAVALALYLRGLRHVCSLLAKAVPKGVGIQNQDYIARAVRMVNIAAQYPTRFSNCLSQSLVLWFLLRRRGIESALRLGVKLHQGKLQAHAWIEYGNEVINDAPEVRQTYAMFPANVLATML